VSPSDIAMVFIGLGELDTAFEWLDRAFEARDDELLHLRLSPFYDGIRGDPRYQRLVRRMNFPE
jgi:serine/threonine-protein kinase